MKIFSKKRIAVLCVVCLIVCMVSGFTSPTAGADVGAKVKPETPAASTAQDVSGKAVPVYINGIRASDGYTIGKTTYIALRNYFDAVGLQADIVWDKQTGTVAATADGFTLAATMGQKYVTMNDRCFYLKEGVQSRDGMVTLPLRVLATAFQYEVTWDKRTSSVSLSADNPMPLETADKHYNQQDLYWLSHLINAEAGNQPFDGKIAVGNVVLNRVADPTCPNTVYDVVFDDRYGVQFSVTTKGGINAEPNAESIVAAKACLEGANVVGNALYFVNPTIASSKWFDKTRTFIATIGEHDFYA